MDAQLTLHPDTFAALVDVLMETGCIGDPEYGPERHQAEIVAREAMAFLVNKPLTVDDAGGPMKGIG